MSQKESILVSKNSPLDERVFGSKITTKEGNNIDQFFFTDWLSINDHIAAQFVSREDFQSLQGDFLREEAKTPESVEKRGEYTLTLPVDLTRGELIQIIDTFRTTLHLDTKEQSPYLQFLAEQVLYLRMSGMSKRELERELATKYNISADLIERIKAVKLTDDKVTEIRQIIAGKSEHILTGNTKVSSQEVKMNQQYQAGILATSTKKLSQALDTAVFHRSKQLVYYGLNLITREKQEFRIQELQNDDRLFAIHCSGNTLDFREKGKENGVNISFRYPSSKLSDQEKTLRESIRVDEYREELQRARNKNDRKAVIKLEKQFTKILLSSLHKFPYQVTRTNNGYFPCSIVDTGEIQCVGFSLIAHVYLSELNITHHALRIPQHSALSVTIGEVEYYFDAAGFTHLYPMRWKKDDEVSDGMRDFNLTYFGIPVDLKRARRGNPETMLQAQILFNCGLGYYRAKKNPETVAYLSRALAIDPNREIYDILISSYLCISNFEHSCDFRNIQLDLQNAGTYYTYGNIIERGNITMGNMNKKIKQYQIAYYIAESISEEDFFYRGMSEVLEAQYKTEKDQIDTFLSSKNPDRYKLLQEWFFKMYDE